MKNARLLKELLIKKEDLEEKIKEIYFDYCEYPCQVDIYAYINDDATDVDIDTFINVGGNSWLDDDHYTIYSLNGSYLTQFEDSFKSDKDFVEFFNDEYNLNIPPFEPDEDEDDYVVDREDMYYNQKSCDIRSDYEKEYKEARNEWLEEYWGWTYDDIYEEIIRTLDYIED